MNMEDVEAQLRYCELFLFIFVKGATSRYFESFSVTCKIIFNVRETTKY